MIPSRAFLQLIAHLGIALGLLLPAFAATDSSFSDPNPITEGHRDRSAPEVPPAVKNTSPVEIPGPAGQPRKRLHNPGLRLPSVPINLNAPVSPRPLPPAVSVPETPAPAPETLILPKLIVTGEKDKPRALPLLHVPTPAKDLPAVFWESPAGRRARLVQKHFTALEQKLDRQKSLEARAARKEAIESAALELNRIAAALDVSAALSQEDAAAQKKIRAEFLRAFYGRPR